MSKNFTGSWWGRLGFISDGWSMALYAFVGALHLQNGQGTMLFCMSMEGIAGDRRTEFLRNKAYPLLEGCTSFLLDLLIEACGGYLQINLSTSHEHTFVASGGKPAIVSYSLTMDMAITNEVFSSIISAAEVDLITKLLKSFDFVHLTVFYVNSNIE